MSLGTLPLVPCVLQTRSLSWTSLHLGELEGTSARGARREVRVWPAGLGVFPNQRFASVTFLSPGLGELILQSSPPSLELSTAWLFLSAILGNPLQVYLFSVTATTQSSESPQKVESLPV